MKVLNLHKWQRMLDIVNQHPTLIHHNLEWQFKKIFISRLLAENILVFLLQYIGLMFSTLTTHSAPVWFASGTACAFTFMRGYSILPGIWLGSFFTYYFATMSINLAWVCATVYVLQALCLRMLSYRFSCPTLIFYRGWTFVKFILCSSMITAVASLMLEFFCYSKLAYAEAPFQLWVQWWLANFNGILIISCAIITWDIYFPQIDSLKRLNKLLLYFIYGLLLTLIIALIFSGNPQSTIFFALSTLLLCVVISTRYGWCGTITAFFLFGMLLTLASYLGAPIFVTEFPAITLIYLQLILSFETMAGILISILYIYN